MPKRPIKVKNLRQTKAGKLERVESPKSVSARIASRKSKRMRVTRRTP